MEGVVENPPHPAPPADKKTTPIGIFLYIVAFWWLKNGNLSGYGRPASERGAFIPTLEKQMKKKALTLAIAAALSAPASFAATDSEGMQYTRASEGFYGRIALQIQSKTAKNGETDIGADAVRIGVRGTNDMGSGLEGFYQWEAGAPTDDTDNAWDGRLATWGVRGAFGQVQMGSFWTADYNWVGANTDLVGVGSGNEGTYYSRAREGRSQRALEYKTPDLNGFQGAVRVSTDGMNGNNDFIGLWNLAATYAVQGFTVGASYNVVPDGLTKTAPVAAITPRAAIGVVAAYCTDGSAVVADTDPVTPNAQPGCTTGTYVAGTARQDEIGVRDAREAVPGVYEDLKTWSLGLAYAQDNWHVAGWYGTDNYSDRKDGSEDSKTLTLGGKVDIGKVGVFANWQRVENHDGKKGMDRSYGGVGVGYSFTQQTSVTGTYRLQDFDDQKNAADEAQNFFRVVMQHNF